MTKPPAADEPVDEPRFEADYTPDTAKPEEPQVYSPSPDEGPEPDSAATALPPPPFPPPGFDGPPPPPFGSGPQQPFGNGLNRGLLVRPQQGRYVAGVCAAIGRATNTDPTLWRVIFAVLTLAGGVSIVAYLLGWLLLPAEGDTGSPLDALLGRGRSATSAPLAVAIGVGAVLAFLLIMSQNFGAALVGLAIVVGVVALVMRGQPPGAGQPAPFVPPAAPPQYGVPASGSPSFGAPSFGAPSFGAPSFGPPSFGPMSFGGTTATATTTAEMPVAAPVAPEPLVAVPPPPLVPPLVPPVVPPMPPMPPTVPGYRPPFAPHGPYSASSPYASSLGVPPPGVPGPPYPGLAPMPPPKRPKQKSRLGRITFFLMVLSVGVLAALAVTGVHLKASTFFAVPLAITALGLLTGAWLGRARVLILLGALLSIALAISTAATVPDSRHTENVSVMPTSIDRLSPRYQTGFGNITANLTKINFVDRDVAVAFKVGLGNIEITVPPDVDVTTTVHLQGGDCRIFGNDCSGLQQTASFTDLGEDGQGGGKLHLDLDLQWGDVRVTR